MVNDAQEKMKTYYNESDYFKSQKNVFNNLESNFQKYRISKVFEIYEIIQGERVLDVGCGWGTFCFALVGRHCEIYGIDYSEKSIEACKTYAEENGLVDNVKFMLSDARNTSLESESFDVVICADLVEHLYPEAYEDVLKEISRVLKNQGKLVIWTPNRGHILEVLKSHNIIFKRDISHVDLKSMNRLISSLTKYGFTVKKAYYVESHLPIVSLFEKIFMSLLPFLRRRIAVLAEKTML